MRSMQDPNVRPDDDRPGFSIEAKIALTVIVLGVCGLVLKAAGVF